MNQDEANAWITAFCAEDPAVAVQVYQCYVDLSQELGLDPSAHIQIGTGDGTKSWTVEVSESLMVFARFELTIQEAIEKRSRS